jgi:hypothetical protein
MKKGDTLILERLPADVKKDCFWHFSAGKSFKSSCNHKLQLKASKDYDWKLDWKWIVLHINTEFYISPKGTMSVANSGAYFRLQSMDGNRITLIYMGDSY